MRIATFAWRRPTSRRGSWVTPPIAEGSIVLIRTGWGSRWPDRAHYLGTTKTGPAAVAELHFPGIHPDAARWLVTHKVRAVGIDTPSIDYGQSTTFDTHRSEEHTSELQSQSNLVCRLLLEKKKKTTL